MPQPAHVPFPDTGRTAIRNTKGEGVYKEVTLPEGENISRLILGTVQFGLNYGISNKRGQLTQQEVNAILAMASKAGISTLDTAAAYGESEASIGSSLKAIETADFKIISKYPPNNPRLSVAEAFQNSLSRLGVNHLYAYLLHSFASYSNNPGIVGELEQLKKTEKVNKIGFSLYHPQEALILLDKEVPVDVVQLPYSVFDQRFEEVMPLLRQKGIETHIRSVYLQGLFFMDPEKLPSKLASVASKLLKLQQLAKDHQLPLGAILLGFAFANPNISHLVIGVESLETLQENLAFCHNTIPQQLVEELKTYREENEEIILPYNWTN